jgi:hypothetical protein
MSNGLYNENLLVCASDNVYINFHCITLIRRDIDFETPIQNKHKNIIFDSFLELTILYNFLSKSDENVLVYDVYKHKIFDVHHYISEKFGIKPWLFNKTFASAYLIINHYFKYLNFKTKNLTGNNLIDILLNTIGSQHVSEYSTDNVNKVILFFKEFSTLSQKTVPKVNRYEFYIALTLLKN